MKHRPIAMQILKDYAIITAGCLLYAFSFNCFFDANGLAMGGFTGISQVLNRFFPFLPIGATVFFLNVPLMILGVKKQGLSLLFASVYAIFVSSVLIDGLKLLFPFPSMDPLMACLFGGVLMGVALGFMMQKNATTGGTELAARLLKYVFRHLSIGRLCLLIDVTVICIYALTFRSLDNALYGILSMYVCSLSMDMVIYGSINAKVAYIVSDHSQEISRRLIELGLGVTILDGRGGYTGSGKQVLLCAARPSMIGRIKAVVTEVDAEKAFLIISDAREVFGEGFGKHGQDIL